MHLNQYKQNNSGRNNNNNNNGDNSENNKNYDGNKIIIAIIINSLFQSGDFSGSTTTF